MNPGTFSIRTRTRVSISSDKKFITSVDQIVDKLRSSLSEFLREKHGLLAELEIVKVYYDCGQAPITKLLHDEIAKGVTCPVEFVQDVRPEKYRLFQLADLICTLHLEELKLQNGEPMTASEFRFSAVRRHSITTSFAA